MILIDDDSFQYQKEAPMVRKPQRVALPWFLAVCLTLSTEQAGASLPPDVWIGRTVTTSTVTRLVAVDEKGIERGEREVTGQSAYTKEQAIGPTTKVISDWETTTYRVKVTSYPLNREEVMEITTTTDHYVRYKTERVVLASRDIWVVNDKMRGDKPADGTYEIRSGLVNVSTNRTDFRDTPWWSDMTQKYYTAAYNNNNSVYINIIPNSVGYNGYLSAQLVFTKDLGFRGGRVYCHNYKAAKVPSAKIFLHDGHHDIQYDLNCVLNEDLNFFQSCATDQSSRTLHVDGLLIRADVEHDYENRTVEEPYDKITLSSSPWTPTGRMVRPPNGRGTTKYETDTEEVLVGERFVVRGENMTGSIAPAGLGGRRIFKGDSGHGGLLGQLSGALVRNLLGAHQTSQSQTKRPEVPIPQKPVATPTPAPKPSQSPQPQSPDKQSHSPNGAAAQLALAASPPAQAWFFPAEEVPMRVRYEAYRRKPG
jgi:hypothetical protein